MKENRTVLMITLSTQNQTIKKEIKLPIIQKFCDYNDAYILARDDITVTTDVTPQVQAIFKHCSPFTRCITKVDGTTIDDAENLDLITAMYNRI